MQSVVLLIGSSLGFSSSPEDTSKASLVIKGIEPLTFRLVDDLLHLLSLIVD